MTWIVPAAIGLLGLAFLYVWIAWRAECRQSEFYRQRMETWEERYFASQEQRFRELEETDALKAFIWDGGGQ